MFKQIILFSFLLCTTQFFAQDEDESTSKFCVEIDNKKALKLYEKATDKKKYKKPERLTFLRECLAEEPDFAEANLAMAREIVVHSKLENKSFAAAVPFFQKALTACPKIHSEPYYYIGYNFYEETKNDSAIKYLQQFLKFKDDDDKKFSREYEMQIYNSKEMIKYAIMVAYTERLDFENLDRYHLTDKFGLDNVFKLVFNDRCKEFLFKKI